MSGSYREAYEASTKDPNAFWLEAADAIDWIKAPTTVSYTHLTLPTK
jgi:propionyl-CoA synthetase